MSGVIQASKQGCAIQDRKSLGDTHTHTRSWKLKISELNLDYLAILEIFLKLFKVFLRYVDYKDLLSLLWDVGINLYALLG